MMASVIYGWIDGIPLVGQPVCVCVCMGTPLATLLAFCASSCLFVTFQFLMTFDLLIDRRRSRFCEVLQRPDAQKAFGHPDIYAYIHTTVLKIC